MEITKLIHQMKPPCRKCTYTLGNVKTVVNPCPQCRLNGCQMGLEKEKNQRGQS